MVAIEEQFDIEGFLASELSKGMLRLATAGSVDDGKSTLIGRLLHDARGAYEDQLKSVRRADGAIDFALLTDGLRAEREQGITIDVAYRFFATPKCKFILADTPGHVQYTRNMATGASTADLAIILVDAKRGLTDQSRRHASIAALLGIRHFVVAVNKMDLVNFDYGIFHDVFEHFMPFLGSLGIVEPYFLPVSALLGDNIVKKSANMPWFIGAPLLEHLESIEVERPLDAPFRMSVQQAVRPNPDFRGYAGQIASGTIRPGDEIVAAGCRSRIKRIVTYDGDLDIAYAPLSVVLTLEDEIDISRGDLISSSKEPRTARSIEATAVWFDAVPIDCSKEYLVKHMTQTMRVRVESDNTLKMNDIGSVRLSLAKPLSFDAYASNRTTGSFILIDRDTNATAAAGMIK